MDVRNIRWAGILTSNYTAMVDVPEWERINFRAQDGNVNELASRRPVSG